jgi:hypothetical protein
MKRVAVFLLVGPLLVAAASFASMHHHRPPRSEWLFTIELFLSTSTASLLVGLIDGYLAHILRVFPRAFLMAAVGAIVTWPMVNAFVLSWLGGIWLRAMLEIALTPGLLTTLAFFGAVYAGVCSLLANDRAGHGSGRADWGS